MNEEKKLDLVILWHMHQPDFRDHATGEFAQPWVYLHAIKDYNDMAAHLEAHPGMRVVLNFTPVLLDQPSITGRVDRPKSQHGDADVWLERLAQRRQRLRAQQRNVGVDNQNVVVAGGDRLSRAQRW